MAEEAQSANAVVKEAKFENSLVIVAQLFGWAEAMLCGNVSLG
jgi:hypothetical protein